MSIIHRMKHRILLMSGLFILLICCTTPLHALPFSIVPSSTLPTTVVQNESVDTTYVVTNNTSTTRYNNYLKYLPPHVVNNGSGTCGSGTFTLAPGGSCTLNLTISGSVNRDDTDPQHHLYVCFPGGTTCAGPTYANQLNIAVITVASIAVSATSPTTPTVPLGDTVQFKAEATYSDGTVVDISNSSYTTWASSDTSVASISSAGLATTQPGKVTGTSNITATSHEVISTPVTLTVTDKVLRTIDITASDNTTSITKRPAATDQFKVTGTYSDSTTTTNTSLFTWNSDANTIVSVNATGLISVVASPSTSAQSADISATLDSITSNTVTITVPILTAITINSPVTINYLPTETNNYTATGTFGSEGSQDVTTSATWASSQTSVATINSSSGVATNVAGGYTTLSATIGTASNTATLGVVPTIHTTGYTTNTTTLPASYFSNDGGNIWTQSTVQPPAQGSSVDNNLNRVSCSSSGVKCISVGEFGSPTQPMSFRTLDSGVNWVASGTQPTPINVNQHVLGGVACTNDGAICSAVGYYDTTGGNVDDLLSYYSSNTGNSWTAAPTPTKPSGTEYHFTAVTCHRTSTVIGTTRCVAVGHYTDTSEKPLAYLSTDGSQTWSVQAHPAWSANNHYLTALACDPAVTKCVAVGYNDSALTFTPEIYYTTSISDSAISWSPSTLPTPPGTGTTYQLRSVSCDLTATNCVAVGDFINTAASNRRDPFVYLSSDSGANWTVGTAPATGSSNRFLLGVKCYPGTPYCSVVGYATGAADTPLAFYSTNQGSTWTVSATPPAQQFTANTRTNGVG